MKTVNDIYDRMIDLENIFAAWEEFKRELTGLAGYILLPYYVVLRTNTKRRMFKKLAIKKAAVNAALISEKSFNQSVQSYLGLLKHCQGYKLIRKIKEVQGLS